MSSDVDFIEEIRIAQFWRKQLGEYEYVYYNPDDLRRWYIALETRGPQEIREYLIERTGRHPMGEVTGIVAVAPHPSRKIIDLWLESYNKMHTRPYWVALVAFLILAYYTKARPPSSATPRCSASPAWSAHANSVASASSGPNA